MPETAAATETIEIKNRRSGKVQFTPTVEAGLSWRVKIGAAVKWAFSNDADLRGADLRGADLRGAVMRDADLSGADLRGVPKVANIDASIIAAIEAGGRLKMSAWHTCGTTHCRAGWAITLAGEAGAALEFAMGPAAAGALIYAVSRPDRPVPNFYTSDADAMADLVASAAEQGTAA